mmetsp:Transcript_41164/g.66751  ORF Transcript_41164/g.66751 Transcript_41164/m.66751 type:complete len:226 (+) Transcript_41164:1516-2193(+)
MSKKASMYFLVKTLSTESEADLFVGSWSLEALFGVPSGVLIAFSPFSDGMASLGFAGATLLEEDRLFRIENLWCPFGFWDVRDCDLGRSFGMSAFSCSLGFTAYFAALESRSSFSRLLCKNDRRREVSLKLSDPLVAPPFSSLGTIESVHTFDTICCMLLSPPAAFPGACFNSSPNVFNDADSSTCASSPIWAWPLMSAGRPSLGSVSSSCSSSCLTVSSLRVRG